jgi:ectoine hydroxylase-related dioxygenase (phytanoyl-CoA dioxygenase family)
MIANLRAKGFCLVQRVFMIEQIDRLLNAIERAGGAASHAIRNLFDAVPEIAELAVSPVLCELVRAVLGDAAFAVRALLFNKTPEANWKVPWHQDLSIAVAEQRHTPGFGPWSIKAGVTHVQPPVEVLEQMRAVRIHLDACGPDNGPLRVIAGSHAVGRLSAAAIQQIERESKSETCAVERGGALLMRPLLLHASSIARTPAQRRVIHIEYAACDLPNGLQWYQRLV